MPADYSFIQETIYVIGNNEASGNYGAVNATDVVSLGIFQWYGTRAYDLCYSIYTVLGATATTEILGEELANQIMQNNPSLWSSFTPDADERSKLSSFITQDSAISIQNSLAETDAWSYIKTGQNYGLSDGQALIYFADLYNQSPRQSVNIVSSAGGAIFANDLTNLHNAAMSNSVMNKYVTRRTWTYNEIIAWGGQSESPPPSGGGGWIGGDYGLASHDYILAINNTLILYSQQYPTGRVYLPSFSNVYFPKNS